MDLPITHLIEAGYYIRTVQEILGYEDFRATMAYTHKLNKGGCGVQSPADFLASRHDNGQRIILPDEQNTL